MATLHEIVLAALLHDIGKFAHHAFPPGEGPDSQTSRGTAPSSHGLAQHARQFCEQHLLHAPALLSAEAVARLAAGCCDPGDAEEAIIAEADHLSATPDRAPGEEVSRRTQLRAVTAMVDIGAGATDGDWVYPLAAWSPESTMPVRVDDRALDPPEGQELTQPYSELWNAFVNEWQQNHCADPWGWLCRAQSILARFTWCVPSTASAPTDVSLFDHSSVAAAIAACLFLADRREERPFLLVTGDFGGIQSYIFGIRAGAGGLARRLRSRSLFVSLLGDGLVHHLLRRLELPLTNCIMAAGGRFYLLLPNSQSARDVVDEARHSTDGWALRETKGEVNVHLAAMPVGKDELTDFAKTLDRCRAALHAEKARPLRSVLCDEQGWVEDTFRLDKLAIRADGELCDSCQRRAGTAADVHDAPICPECKRDAEAGGRLPKCRYVAFYEDASGECHLPYGTYTLVESQTIRGSPYLVLDLDGEVLGPAPWPLIGQRRARHIPTDRHRNAVMFEDLADRALGRNALAYLKADVDNLGLIFAQGLTGSASGGPSVSRFAALSRSLDLFFSGWLETQLRRDFPTVYTVYAGGDDVLCIGPWDQAIRLAYVLRREFRNYTCHNPSWALSAGIVVVRPKTPVLLGNRQAEDRLEASKHTPGTGIAPYPPERADPGEIRKDRITVFGASVPWASFDRVLDNAEQLLGWLDDRTLRTSQIWRLLQYAHMHRQYQRTGDTAWFRWVPQLVYDLKRNWRHGRAREWANSLVQPHNPDMDALIFACHYALYGVRGTRKERT